MATAYLKTERLIRAIKSKVRERMVCFRELTLEAMDGGIPFQQFVGIVRESNPHIPPDYWKDYEDVLAYCAAITDMLNERR